MVLCKGHSRKLTQCHSQITEILCAPVFGVTTIQPTARPFLPSLFSIVLFNSINSFSLIFSPSFFLCLASVPQLFFLLPMPLHLKSCQPNGIKHVSLKVTWIHILQQILYLFIEQIFNVPPLCARRGSMLLIQLWTKKDTKLCPPELIVL